MIHVGTAALGCPGERQLALLSVNPKSELSPNNS